MSYTHISDVIVPAVWGPYTIQRTSELSELITSGIIVPDAQFDDKANSGGATVNMPFWTDLTGDDETLSDSVSLTPGKIGASQDVAVCFERGKAWENNDLAGILAGSDPANAMSDLVAEYWARRYQAQTLSILKGVFSIAGMAGLVNAIHATVGVPGAANYLTGATFVDSCQKLGDAKGMLAAVIMHSAVEAALTKQDLIDFIPDSKGEGEVKVFQGKRVIVDDGMPVETINGALVFTTYIFARGAIAHGVGTQVGNKPVEGGFGTWATEFYRTALAGNSGFINRRRSILHLRGIKWLGAVQAGQSPTNAELENAGNWARVYELKKIRVVKVTHNIAT